MRLLTHPSSLPHTILPAGGCSLPYSVLVRFLTALIAIIRCCRHSVMSAYVYIVLQQFSNLLAKGCVLLIIELI